MRRYVSFRDIVYPLWYIGGIKSHPSYKEVVMYVRVYAPNGEPFDVSRDRADHLILNAGWTQSVPEDSPVEEGDVEVEKPSRRKRKSADSVTSAEE